jgi:hypothetical protein
MALVHNASWHFRNTGGRFSETETSSPEPPTITTTPSRWGCGYGIVCPSAVPGDQIPRHKIKIQGMTLFFIDLILTGTFVNAGVFDRS